MVECTIDEIQGNVVKPWKVDEGELVEVNIGGNIFAVRKDAKVDPIKAAKDFLAAYDIQKTSSLRKRTDTEIDKKDELQTKIPTNNTEPSKPLQAIVNRISYDNVKQPLMRNSIKRTKEIAGEAYNLPVIKDDIIGFYRIKPDTFTTEAMKSYFINIYINKIQPGTRKLAENTVLNKQRATLKFLVDTGYVKQIEGRGNYKRKYKWEMVPYGAKPAAQAEVSSQYFKDLQKRELMAFRES